MRVQIKSVFEQIAEQVFKMNDANQIKKFITEFFSEKRINEDDKKTILTKIEQLKTPTQIQKYICNSLLQYEGLSVGVKKMVD